MPTPSTLNEALAEIEVLNTQIAYLTEQADIASAITNKVIPDYSTSLSSVATNTANIKAAIDDVTGVLTETHTTPSAPPAAPVVTVNSI